jgi:hypothetical protein
MCARQYTRAEREREKEREREREREKERERERERGRDSVCAFERLFEMRHTIFFVAGDSKHHGCFLILNIRNTAGCCVSKDVPHKAPVQPATAAWMISRNRRETNPQPKHTYTHA